MGPGEIFFAIRALIRVGTAAQQAYEQSVREGPIKVPGIERILGTIKDGFNDFYWNIPTGKNLVATGSGELAKYWDAQTKAPKRDMPAAQPILMRRYLEWRAAYVDKPPTQDWLATTLASEPGAVLLLTEWQKGQGPVSPWMRVALALAEVAIGYVKVRPDMFGVSGKGEQFLQGLSDNLSLVWPDLDKQKDAARAGFAQRMLAIVLHSGLKTIADKPSIVAGPPEYQAMTAALIVPLKTRVDAALAKTDGTAILKLIQLESLRDEVFPEMCKVAIGVVADNPDFFLTKAGVGDNAAAALTGAFLDFALENSNGAWDAGGAVRWIGVYRALMGVIASRPELIEGGQKPRDAIVRDVVAACAGALGAGTPPFSPGWLPDLAAAVMEAAASSAKPWRKDPWHEVAISAVQDVVGGLAEGLKQEKFPPSYGKATLLAIARSIVEQAAKTPEMLTRGTGPSELNVVVAGVAAAMSVDKNLSIDGDGWIRIAAVAAAEAATDPQGLFRMGEKSPEQQLAVKLVGELLRASATSLARVKRVENGRGGALLFGQTLVEAIEHTFRVASGNALRAAKNLDALYGLAMSLEDIALAQFGVPDADGKPPAGIGATEWLWLFRHLLTGALDTGKVETNRGKLLEILYAGRK